MRRSGQRFPGEISILILIAFCVFLNCEKEKDSITVEGRSGKTEKGTVTGETEKGEIPNPDVWYTASPGSWKIVDGVMSGGGSGDIWTVKRYGNFVLECEFKISPKGNSGIFFRTGDMKDPVQTGIEMQVIDTAGYFGEPVPDEYTKNVCGAMYDLLEPSVNVEKPAGEWNHVAITCKDNGIEVVMNGVKIIEMDIDIWVTPHKNPDGTDNKFDRAFKDFPLEGHIGFQDHGDPVWYRNVKIRER